MPTVARLPYELACPAGCGVREALACTLKEERRLRADVKRAAGSPDLEVIASDLHDIEHRVDAILAYALKASR